MFERDSSQADVARELGVSRETASLWFAAWHEGGAKALAGAGRAGRLPKLSDQQLAKVETALSKGPRGNGFATELWTLARLATVIETVTGVSYSTTQTWWILRERLGWSRQRPARKALEGAQEAIAAWACDRWPVVKKRPTAARVDRRRRRVGLLAPPLGEVDLVTKRPDAGVHPPLQLEATLDGRGAGLRSRRHQRVDGNDPVGRDHAQLARIGEHVKRSCKRCALRRHQPDGQPIGEVRAPSSTYSGATPER
jgi:transposase